MLQSANIISKAALESANTSMNGIHRPMVNFNGNKGILVVKGLFVKHTGISIENSLGMLIKDYLDSNHSLRCYFYFENMNWPTIQSLFSIFKVLKEYERKGKNISINWFSNPEMSYLIDTGYDFAELFNLKIDTHTFKSDFRIPTP